LTTFAVKNFLSVLPGRLLTIRDAILQQNHAEPDQKAHLDVQESQVRPQLSLIHRMQSFLAFELNSNSPFHDQMRSKPAIKLRSLIDQRHGLLPRNAKSKLFAFVCQTSLVR
jgi:hypothetical protein